MGINMPCIQANRGNSFPPTISAQYTEFLTGLFFLIWKHISAKMVCALFAQNLRLDHSSGLSFRPEDFLSPIIPHAPLQLVRFRFSTTLENVLARCCGPIASTKALLARGACLPVGNFFHEENSLFWTFFGRFFRSYGNDLITCTIFVGTPCGSL